MTVGKDGGHMADEVEKGRCPEELEWGAVTWPTGGVMATPEAWSCYSSNDLNKIEHMLEVKQVLKCLDVCVYGLWTLFLLPLGPARCRYKGKPHLWHMQPVLPPPGAQQGSSTVA